MKSRGTLTLEETGRYIYLGVLIKTENEGNLNLRLAKINTWADALNQVLRSFKTKTLLYKSVLRRTVLCGSEAWVLSRKMRTKIKVWKREML